MRAHADDAVAAEVLALLEADATAQPLLDGQPLDALPEATADDLAALPEAGRLIGPYHIIEEVGRGGMGAVYRAERADGAFEQTVALKLVKRGMDSEAVLARFRAERQILARLDHPGIARVLDGGLADDGRPWLAMEFVEGLSITDYCNAHRLGVGPRIALFQQVCEAVAYAHRQLVVHRDLKPSNILVTSEGRVKLLDFGIAKVLAGDDADEPLTVLTGPGQLVLTPEYAAPEQVAGEPVSTATDVYALGVVLYELLAGQRPYSFDARTPAVIDHVVRTVEPPRPSTVVADAPPTTGLTPDRLRRQLAGDLDTICLVALRKEPERRYTSVEALADDLHRHRDGLPVLARPDTAGYRARKFVRRHRTGLGALAASVAAISLVAGLAFARVGDERDLAEVQRDRAEAEARRSEEVVSFLRGLLLGASPYEAPGEELTARELVDRGAERVQTDLASEPATQAAIQALIGEVYMDLGRPENAVPLYRASLATREAEGLDAEAASVARELGRALRETERPDEAELHLRASIAAFDVLPEADPTERALSQRHLGSLLRDQGDFEAAEALYREALATARAAGGPDDPLVGDITNSLVILLRATDRVSEAADLMADLVASDRRVLPPNHPDLGTSLAIQATLFREAERGTEAVAAAREALAVYRAAHPDTTHPDVASGVHGLAIALRADGQREAAVRTYRTAIDRLGAAYGTRDLRTLAAVMGYAELLAEAGRLDAAATQYRQAAEASRAYPANAGRLWAGLAAIRRQQRRWDDGFDAYRRAADAYRAAERPDDVSDVHEAWAEAAREARRPGDGPSVSMNRSP
ncbi:MAG: serine/threonine-protein kinase [Bacteroidota bacterium]